MQCSLALRPFNARGVYLPAAGVATGMACGVDVILVWPSGLWL
jgi:hypothetical protein